MTGVARQPHLATWTNAYELHASCFSKAQKSPLDAQTFCESVYLLVELREQGPSRLLPLSLHVSTVENEVGQTETEIGTAQDKRERSGIEVQ